MNSELLKIGSTITIERSDGRIHSATVSKIDYNLAIIDVEWMEENSIRGKQLNFDTIIALNPSITIRNRNHNNSSSELTTFNKTTNHQSKIKLPNSTRLNQTPIVPDTTRLAVARIEIERNRRRQKQAKLQRDKLEVTKQISCNPYYEWQQMIETYQSKLKRQPLRINDNIVNNHVITVCVRKRPLSKSELLKKEIDVITVTTKNELILHEPKTKVNLTKYLNQQLFKFDIVFDENCTNEAIYKFTAKPLIKNLFNGGNSTCFAYGQTGSGKTYTIFGDTKNKDNTHGIYTLIIRDIFELVHSIDYKQLNFKISCSFFEIYSRKILDLFHNKHELKMFENHKQQIQIIGLTEKLINKIDDLFQFIQDGNNLRTSSSTTANTNSSRSHAIFQIYLKRDINNESILYGKFSLIDLAGNERGTNTLNASKLTHSETGEINKSLLALKECIRALGRKDSVHIPFRSSKLTEILRDSFIGKNIKTCMIATISPNINSCEDTLNTLRYADRVKELSVNNNNDVDEDRDDAVLVGQQSATIDERNDNLVILKENHNKIIRKLNETNQQLKNLTNMIDSDLDNYRGNLQNILDNTMEFLVKSKDIVI